MNTFSIVVFAKNEEGNIHFVVDQLLQKYTSDKIIFVLDGDIEPTINILSESNIRFIRGDDKGKGAAIKTAVQNIDSDILIFMDADGSHDPGEIESLLRPLFNDEAEMVIASRFLGYSEELYGNMADRIRYAGNVIGNVVINFLWNKTGKNISDAQNGFRSIKRAVFLDLSIEENSFSVEQEMVIKCLKKGYRICEVPSSERKRRCGRSHISALHFIDYARCIIKNVF